MLLIHIRLLRKFLIPSHPVVLPVLRSIASIFTWLAASLIALVPAALAIDFGGVLPWSQWALSVVAIVGVTLALSACLSPERARGLGANGVALSLLMLGLFGWIQAMPLSFATLQSLAPASHEAYQWAWQPLDGSTSDQSLSAVATPHVTLSAWLTRSASALAIAVAACALVGSQVFHNRGRILLLLVVLASTGAMVAVLGIMQTLKDPSATVWGLKSTLGGYPFGPFFNRNNAAAMLNIGLACNFGMIAWRLAALTGVTVSDGEFPLNELFDVFFDRTTLAGIIGGLICMIGLVTCGSRGGLVGAVAGIMLALGILQMAARGRGLIGAMLGIGLMAAILLVKLELPTTSIDRLSEAPEAVEGFAKLDDGRWDHWRDASRAAMAQPVWGWGLGAYRYSYLPFQQSSAGSWFLNADNLWLEWFVETGLIGMTILIVALYFLIRSLRTLHESPDPLDHGLSIAGWFALGSLSVSQFFDFGLRLPANAVAAALLFSAIQARAQLAKPQFVVGARQAGGGRDTQSKSSALRRFHMAMQSPLVNLALFGVTLVALVPAMRFLAVHADGDFLIRSISKLPRGLELNVDEALGVVRDLEQHVTSHPENDEAWLALSELQFEIARVNAANRLVPDRTPADWQRVYRVLAPGILRTVWYDRLAKEPIDAPEPQDRKQGLAGMTVAMPLLKSDGEGAGEEVLFTNSQAAEERQVEAELGVAFQRARASAVSAILACPQSDQALMRAVRLDFAGGSPGQSDRLLAQVVKLRNRFAPSLRFVGELATQGRLWTLAATAFYEAIRLQPDQTQAVLRSWDRTAPIPMGQLIPNEPAALAAAAQLELGQAQPDVALLTRAISVLRQSPASDRAAQVQQLLLISRIEAKRGKLREAARSIAEAVSLSPGNMDIRYQHALALKAAGQLTEARAQARAGRQIAPTDTRFEQLLESMKRSDPIMLGDDEDDEL